MGLAAVKKGTDLERYLGECRKIEALLGERKQLTKAPLSKTDLLEDLEAQVAWARGFLEHQVRGHVDRTLVQREQRLEPPNEEWPILWRTPVTGLSGFVPAVDNAIALLALAPVIHETIEGHAGAFGDKTRGEREKRIAAIDREVEKLRNELRATPQKLAEHHWSCVSERFTVNEAGGLVDTWPAVP